MLFFFLPFFLNFFYFLGSIFLAFFVPGVICLKGVKISEFQKSVLSIGLGIVLWGWQGFLFGYFGVRWLSYIYLFVFFLLWLKIQDRKIRIKSFFKETIKNVDPIVFSIVVTGVLLQTSIVWLMGVSTDKGLYFCCGAIGDFIYHLGLTGQIISRFPPYEQDMFGVEVSNYHYWGNLVVAELVRVFHLPLVFTQFQYIGLVLSLLFGFSAIVFSELNKLSKYFIRWLLFFLYFGGDFIYIVILATRRTLDLSMGPLENGLAFLNNPPRAFAVVLFFIGLSFLSLWIRKKDLRLALTTSFVLGSLVGFKVYIGIFALCGLVFLGVYYVWKKNFTLLPLIILTFLFALVVYLPVNKNSGGMIFTGFWRAEEFIVQPALGLSHLELARQVFYTHGNFFRVFLYDVVFALLFLFGILGSKLLGLVQTKKSLKELPFQIHFFLIPSMLVSLIAGLFFWQKSGGSNSFNFLVSVYIIGSIYTAIAVSYWTSKLRGFLKYTIIVLIVFVNMPRIFYEEQKTIHSLIAHNGYRLTQTELEAMNFLKSNTQKHSIVVTKDVQYHPFISERNMFLGDYTLLGSHDVDTSQRQKIQETIFESSDAKIVKNLLKENNISYIYIPVSFSFKLKNQNLFSKPIYKNDQIQILQVL